jgi:hypothetical protein
VAPSGLQCQERTIQVFASGGIYFCSDNDFAEAATPTVLQYGRAVAPEGNGSMSLKAKPKKSAVRKSPLVKVSKQSRSN